MTRHSQARSKSKKLEQLEKQREIRRQRNILKKQRQAENDEYINGDDDFKLFSKQLSDQGYQIKEILGDGNCLFRALADQLNGDCGSHVKHRKDVVDYMRKNKDDFAPFLDETVSFDKYLKDLSSDGTYAGNDCIVAFARLHRLNIIIHQLNSAPFCVNGKECSVGQEPTPELHLAYHNFEHYSSVRSKKSGNGPGYVDHVEKTELKEEGNTNQVHAKEASIPKNNKERRKLKKQEKKIARNSQSTKKDKEIPNKDNSMDEMNSKFPESIEDNLGEYLWCDSDLDVYMQHLALQEDESKNKVDCKVFNDGKASESRGYTIEDEIVVKDVLLQILENVCQEVETSNPCTDTEFSNKDCLFNGNEDLATSVSEQNSMTSVSEQNSMTSVSEQNSMTSVSEQNSTNSVSELKNNTTKKHLSKAPPQKYLSNRQRKELARQEKKKRKESERRENYEKQTISNSNPPVQSLKCINI